MKAFGSHLFNHISSVALIVHLRNGAHNECRSARAGPPEWSMYMMLGGQNVLSSRASFIELDGLEVTREN